GFAFMTARRMLFGTFYADETFLVRRPDWLPEAIARTQSARPPIVVIADWPINGTERSRFKVWAADYVRAVEALARDRIEIGNVTIYTLESAPSASASQGQ